MGVSKAADHQDDLFNKINSAKANSEITTQTETYSRDRGTQARIQCLSYCLVPGNPRLKVTLISSPLSKHKLTVWLL